MTTESHIQSYFTPAQNTNHIYVFVALVKRGVLNLLGEIRRDRNDRIIIPYLL